MPLKRDTKKGGTEKDGKRSIKYCSLCYKKGEFTNPDIDTAEKMQNFCISEMRKCFKGPKVISWFYERKIKKTIPKLERWRIKIK